MNPVSLLGEPGGSREVAKLELFSKTPKHLQSKLLCLNWGMGTEEGEKAAKQNLRVEALSSTAFAPIPLASLPLHLCRIRRRGCDA